jgi:hypothetical protein
MKSFAQAINMIGIEATTVIPSQTEVSGYGQRYGDLYAIAQDQL